MGDTPARVYSGRVASNNYGDDREFGVCRGTSNPELKLTRVQRSSLVIIVRARRERPGDEATSRLRLCLARDHPRVKRVGHTI